MAEIYGEELFTYDTLLGPERVKHTLRGEKEATICLKLIDKFTLCSLRINK